VISEAGDRLVYFFPIQTMDVCGRDDERRRTRLLDRKSQSTERSGRALERKAIVDLVFFWVEEKVELRDWVMAMRP
jgi:hypothetical protein